jgi:type IX secretion system PorP/SprF family membrane protein
MKKIILILAVWAGYFGWSQDPIFTQFYNVPETLNPSFTAVDGSTKVNVAHRSQWAGLNYNLSSQFANFNAYVDNINSGFGISMLNLLETHTRYRFTQATLNYAYRVPLSADWVFIPSLSFGFGNKDFSFDSLLLEDQIDIPNSIINLQSGDPALLNATSNFFDFSVGGLIMNDNFWLGIGARHLNRPNISFEYNGNEKLNIFLSVHAGFSYQLDNIFYTWEQAQLRFLVNFMNQGVYKRMDFGAEVELKSGLTMGAILATSPVKYDDQSHNLNSINLPTGFAWDSIKVGYSYDVNLSGLMGTHGVHEITLTYTFDSIFNSSFGCWRCQN